VSASFTSVMRDGARRFAMDGDPLYGRVGVSECEDKKAREGADNRSTRATIFLLGADMYTCTNVPSSGG